MKYEDVKQYDGKEVILTTAILSRYAKIKIITPENIFFLDEKQDIIALRLSQIISIKEIKMGVRGQ